MKLVEIGKGEGVRSDLFMLYLCHSDFTNELQCWCVCSLNRRFLQWYSTHQSDSDAVMTNGASWGIFFKAHLFKMILIG